MSSLEVLNKKKRIRAGHRGSVKRIIGQAQESLEGERNLMKLTQSLMPLKDKLVIITKLDAEILDVTKGEEADIASKIEQADILREVIDTNSSCNHRFKLSTYASDARSFR